MTDVKFAKTVPKSKMAENDYDYGLLLHIFFVRKPFFWPESRFSIFLT